MRDAWSFKLKLQLHAKFACLSCFTSLGVSLRIPRAMSFILYMSSDMTSYHSQEEQNSSSWPQHSIFPAHLSGIHDWSFGRVASAARNWPVLVKQKHPAGFTKRNTQHYLLIQTMSMWCDSNSWARPAHCKHEQAKIDLLRHSHLFGCF